ncbi:PfkB family carbohydrate kinase [Streptomyces sp. AF1A]|uniref:PfkB family carbohydrate kinase n=1 Tax=Streptomyces sp. AF1A TaxID=3394350 RepID=UPI0039BD6EE2
MVTFLPSRPGRLADVPSFDRAIGGAESNVACALAAFGHTARWVSRVGADGFGDHLVERIAAHGVDVSSVRRDPARPTGVYFRTAADRATGAHEVAYYRAGSAASAMSTANVDLAAVRAGRVLHLSGITAALSRECRALLHDLTAPRPGRPLVSFDVNHRPGLWQGADGGAALLELARSADLVFVGEDEAEEAWGVTGGPDAVRRLLPEPAVLVVKQGARGATAFERTDAVPALADGGTPARGRAAVGAGAGPDRADGDPRSPGRQTVGVGPAGTDRAPRRPGRAGVAVGAGPVGAEGDPQPPGGAGVGVGVHPAGAEGGPSAPGREGIPPGTFEPAPTVDVVATVGAGDAFAAGFLSGTLRGLPLRERLRHGHLVAAATLTAPGDLAPPPARDHADRLAALDDEAWGRLRLGPGWTQAGAEKEAITP